MSLKLFDNKCYSDEILSTKPESLFIVLEGLDRCGKSTQIDKLFEYIEKNHPTSSLSSKPHCISFPMRKDTCTGSIINSYLKSEINLFDETIHLLFSENRWEKANWIRNTIEVQKEWILCSRYAYSGIILIRILISFLLTTIQS